MVNDNLEINTQSDNIESEKNNELSIDKKAKLKYLILGFIWFLSILLSLLSVLFKPLYGNYYYGQGNDYFKYGIGSGLLIGYILLIKLLVVRKMKIKFEKDKTPVSWPILVGVYLFCFLFVLFISMYMGFKLKFTYDIGNNMPSYFIGQYFTKIAYRCICLYVAINMMEAFQYAVEDFMPTKGLKIHNYIPYGAILLILTYGIFGLITGVGGSFKILYFFMCLIYGEIYLLCKRSVFKATMFSLLIFIL